MGERVCTKFELADRMYEVWWDCLEEELMKQPLSDQIWDILNLLPPEERTDEFVGLFERMVKHESVSRAIKISRKRLAKDPEQQMVLDSLVNDYMGFYGTQLFPTYFGECTSFAESEVYEILVGFKLYIQSKLPAIMDKMR